MKAKLIKTKQELIVNYHLKNENGYTMATTLFPVPTEVEYAANSRGITLQRLSHENCQAIERGYDLDELAENEFPYDLDSPLFETLGITEKAQKSILIGILQGTLQKGFQKALELMSDNKFNKRDMISAYNDGKNSKESVKAEGFGDFIFIQSLQQTEWSVEIEMEEKCRPMPMIHQKYYEPKLDTDGCLILKKI